MCNLYSNTMPVEAMRRLFKVAPEQDLLGNQPPLEAIFPRYDAPVVRIGTSGKRELVRMHWGFLMPQKSKRTGKPIQPKAVNNARDDKLRSSSFWRSSFNDRRCLVPATAFCEAKGKAPATYYWFGLSGEEIRPPFAFAGLWRSFQGEYRGEMAEVDTFSIVTTTPNAVVRPVHPERMPVILETEHYNAWLTGRPDDALALAKPWPASSLRIIRSGEAEKADPVVDG